MDHMVGQTGPWLRVNYSRQEARLDTSVRTREQINDQPIRSHVSGSVEVMEEVQEEGGVLCKKEDNWETERVEIV